MLWIIRGSTATALQDRIQTAIDDEIAELRGRVVDGTGGAPILEVPVAKATYTELTSAVRQLRYYGYYIFNNIPECASCVR